MATVPSLQAIEWPQNWRPHPAGVGKIRVSKNAGRRLRILRSGCGAIFYAERLVAGRWRSMETLGDGRPRTYRTFNAAARICEQAAEAEDDQS